MQIQEIWKAFTICSTQLVLKSAQTIQCVWHSYKFQSLHKKIFHEASMIQTSWIKCFARTAQKALKLAHLDRLISTKFRSLQTKKEFNAASLIQTS